MKVSNLVEDIKPVSEFRAHSAQLIAHARETGRPLVLTQHGRSSVVLMDVGVFELMREELELLRDLRLAEKEIDEGLGLEHEEVRKQILAAVQQ